MCINKLIYDTNIAAEMLQICLQLLEKLLRIFYEYKTYVTIKDSFGSDIWPKTLQLWPPFSTIMAADM